MSSNTNKRNISGFKNWLGCYGTTKKRVFEGFLCNKTLFFDLGIKYRFFSEHAYQFTELHKVRIIQDETSFSDSFLEPKTFRDKKDHILTLKILRKFKRKRYLLKARILCRTKKGYLVGVAGLIGFVPRCHVEGLKTGLIYFFYVSSVSLKQFSFTLVRNRPGIAKKKISVQKKKRVNKSVGRKKETMQ